jgi:hypothetical protein
LLALTDASPEAFALAFALACTGELNVPVCGAGCDGCSFEAGFAKSAFGASRAPVSDPDPLPLAVPLTPEVAWFAPAAAPPAPFSEPAMPEAAVLVVELAAPLAVPDTPVLAEDTVDEAVLCTLSRVEAARSRTRPEVSRVRSIAPDA